MDTMKQSARHSIWVIVSAITILSAGYAGPVFSDEVKVALSGGQEIPPVTTPASGIGTITVGADKSITGSVTVSGMSASVAHIHDAAAGKNGPIVIPLTQSPDNVWSVPAGVKLTDSQHESYRAGNLYFNIHSAAHKGGEIRGQIKP